MQKERNDFIVFWAKKCRENMSECQKQVFSFINSQLIISNNFYNKLKKTDSGMLKIKNLKKL
jgi:hypothetical protein